MSLRAIGESVARTYFSPILRSHRVTLEQMAILEPAMSETCSATFIVAMREAMEEAIKRGVPRQAAFDFLMGHINVQLAIVFEQIDWRMSEGAYHVIDRAMKRIFRPDWKVKGFCLCLIFACLLIPIGTAARTGLICIGVLAMIWLRTTKRRFLYMGLMAAAGLMAIPFLPASFTARIRESLKELKPPW